MWWWPGRSESTPWIMILQFWLAITRNLDNFRANANLIMTNMAALINANLLHLPLYSYFVNNWCADLNVHTIYLFTEKNIPLADVRFLRFIFGSGKNAPCVTLIHEHMCNCLRRLELAPLLGTIPSAGGTQTRLNENSTPDSPPQNLNPHTALTRVHARECEVLKYYLVIAITRPTINYDNKSPHRI